VGRVLAGLGAISYSLYLVHQFNVPLMGRVVARVTPVWTPGWVSIGLQVAGLLGVATVFWYFCERPFLNPRLALASAVAAQEAGGRRSGTIAEEDRRLSLATGREVC
jgi:peptidoglycan/LPS O-acetylase OafA/YrhL